MLAINIEYFNISDKHSDFSSLVFFHVLVVETLRLGNIVWKPYSVHKKGYTTTLHFYTKDFRFYLRAKRSEDLQRD